MLLTIVKNWILELATFGVTAKQFLKFVMYNVSHSCPD